MGDDTVCDVRTEHEGHDFMCFDDRCLAFQCSRPYTVISFPVYVCEITGGRLRVLILSEDTFRRSENNGVLQQ